MQETTSSPPPSERPPRRPLPSFLFPLIACLTLGLAPFSPEPHVVGKLRWAAGGAEGMALVDWVDLFMHGAPWLWLVGSTITWLRKRSAAATGGRLPLLMVGLLAACSPAAPEAPEASDTTAPEAPEVQPAGLSEGTPDEVAVHTRASPSCRVRRVEPLRKLHRFESHRYDRPWCSGRAWREHIPLGLTHFDNASDRTERFEVGSAA